jgi:hypothetical protein
VSGVSLLDERRKKGGEKEGKESVVYRVQIRMILIPKMKNLLMGTRIDR